MPNVKPINLNIILHGLLFLELDKAAGANRLKITAPDLHGDHHLLMGVPGNLQNIDFQEIHWESLLQGGTPGQLKNGIPDDVPNTIYQFHRGDTGVGNIDKPKDQGKIFLPWPAGWDSIRMGPRPRLGTRLPNKNPAMWVYKDIAKRCAQSIGVATVLKYTYPLDLPPIPNWTPTANIEVYFQPDAPEKVSKVNSDLTIASSKLFSSDSFDLIIDESDTTSSASAPIGLRTYPAKSGLSVTDEISLGEKVSVLDPKKMDEATRSALLKIESYALALDASFEEGVKRDNSTVQESDVEVSPKIGLAASLLMINPANCPMFFLGGG